MATPNGRPQRCEPAPQPEEALRSQAAHRTTLLQILAKSMSSIPSSMET